MNQIHSLRMKFPPGLWTQHNSSLSIAIVNFVSDCASSSSVGSAIKRSLWINRKALKIFSIPFLILIYETHSSNTAKLVQTIKLFRATAFLLLGCTIVTPVSGLCVTSGRVTEKIINLNFNQFNNK